MPKIKTGVVRGRRFWSITPAKTKRRKAEPSLPRKMSSKELCTGLVAIAAFHVEDEIAQSKIYEAVRRLQLLEVAAIDAGLIPTRDDG